MVCKSTNKNSSIFMFLAIKKKLQFKYKFLPT